MGILEGKKLLITGVLTDSSIAFHVARLAQQEGATIVLSSFGRALSITNRIAGRLPIPVPVVELDVTDPDQVIEAVKDLDMDEVHKKLAEQDAAAAQPDA